jgi:superfamily II DNA or RNA helicase
MNLAANLEIMPKLMQSYVIGFQLNSIYSNERFKLLIFDECHHFPASTYSRLAFLDADYRLGLSGSPYREDGRSELIYVLSGYPYGSDWDKLFEEGWVKKPEINLHVTSAKITFLQSLLQTLKGNTIVFSDSLTTGEESSRLTGIGRLSIFFCSSSHSSGHT